MEQGQFSMKKRESEKHKNWGMPPEGFKGHVAADGSLLDTAGKWRACGWPVVQLDYDEETGPLHGMYGSMEAEFEVQRTIKRAELMAFLYLLKKGIGQSLGRVTPSSLKRNCGRSGACQGAPGELDRHHQDGE